MEVLGEGYVITVKKALVEGVEGYEITVKKSDDGKKLKEHP